MESVFSTSLVCRYSDWKIIGGQQIFLLNRFLIFIEQANGFSKHSLWVPLRMSCFHGWLKSQKWLRSLDRHFCFVANECYISAFFFPFPLYFISLLKALYVSFPTTHKALYSVIHSHCSPSFFPPLFLCCCSLQLQTWAFGLPMSGFLPHPVTCFKCFKQRQSRL